MLDALFSSQQSTTTLVGRCRILPVLSVEWICPGTGEAGITVHVRYSLFAQSPGCLRLLQGIPSWSSILDRLRAALTFYFPADGSRTVDRGTTAGYASPRKWSLPCSRITRRDEPAFEVDTGGLDGRTLAQEVHFTVPLFVRRIADGSQVTAGRYSNALCVKIGPSSFYVVRSLP